MDRFIVTINPPTSGGRRVRILSSLVRQCLVVALLFVSSSSAYNLEARIYKPACGSQDLVARMWQPGSGQQDVVARIW